ncbi:MAG: 2-oxoacid:acceptor oxidoreductase family protein [Candidatus Hermodarchaeota archaeon]
MITEIRFLSRGGQGGVTGAKMLAYAGALDEYKVQAIPKYGAERKGAPLFADVRIGDTNILTHAPVQPHAADYWIILDSALKVPFDQIKEGAVVVFNSMSIPEYAREHQKKIRMGYVDATKIARECGLVKSGTVLVSSTMLGAWAKAAGLIKLESIEKSIEKQFGKGPLAEQNIKSIRMAYEQFQFAE